MGMGLFLLVKRSGSRSWVQRIMINGHRRDIGLGSPPVVTLAEAREQGHTPQHQPVFVRDTGPALETIRLGAGQR